MVITDLNEEGYTVHVHISYVSEMPKMFFQLLHRRFTHVSIEAVKWDSFLFFPTEGSFLRGKGHEGTGANHFHLVPILRMSGY